MYLPKLKFNPFRTLLPATSNLQKGFALIPVLVLLLIGIAAGTLLIQNGTNFLPKAQSELVNCTFAASISDPQIRDAEFNKLKKCPVQQIEVSHVQILSTGENLTTDQVNEGIRNGNINPDNIQVWCSLTPAQCPPPSNNCSDPSNIKKCADIGTLCQKSNVTGSEYCVDGSNNACINGLIVPYDGRGNFTASKLNCPNGCEFDTTAKIYVCSKPQTASEEKCSNGWNVGATYITDCSNPKQIKAQVCNRLRQVANINGGDSVEKLCEDGSCINPEACKTNQRAPAQPASTEKANQPGVVGNCKTPLASCTSPKVCKEDNLGVRWCVDPNWTEGGSCGNGCVVIGGLPKKPYPENTDPNGCNEDDKRVCPATEGKKCTVFNKKIGDKTYWYSACERIASAAAAQPQRPTTGAPATATQPQTTSSKTPWDTDADGNSSKINQVLDQAAKATSGSTDNAVDAIDAARKAKAAYISGFDKAYNDVFKANISSDADARKVRDEQANYVAIHAYIAKEYPGINWAEAKQKGYDYRALENLRRAATGWVIPQNATVDLGNIKSPDGAPSSTGNTINRAQAVECGYDADGIAIPCFQVGVFASYDELQAVQSQASIAAERYTKSRQILEAAKGKVDAQLLEIAAQKIKEAEEKANACLRQ